MKVADRRDWFAVEGGAEAGRQAAQDGRRCPTLLAAIREGRRYVPRRARTASCASRRRCGRRWRAPSAGVFETRGGALQVCRRRERRAAAAWSRTRRRSRPAPPSRRCGGACARARPRRRASPPALDAALRPYQRGGRRLAGAPRPLGRGRVPRRRDGPRQDGADAGRAVAPGGAGAGAGGRADLGGRELGRRRRRASRPTLTVRLLPRPAARGAALRGLGPGDLVVTSYAIATLDAEALARDPASRRWCSTRRRRSRTPPPSGRRRCAGCRPTGGWR